MSRGGASQRGNVAMLFALTLLVIMGFVAFTVDIGHDWVVREQLQNAADTAALAGVRSLTGVNNNGQFASAVTEAQLFSSMEQANATPVLIPDSDVTLGHWDFTARTFTPGTALPYQVNAVKAVTRRTAATGNPVANTFGALLGSPSANVTATAIAAGGSPNKACGFPLVVSDCSILDPSGNLACNTTLRFISGQTQNVGFTLMLTTNPSTPDIACAFAEVLGQPCAGNCGAKGLCGSTCLGGSLGQIRVSNGNNLPQSVINWINSVAPIKAQLPVIASGQPPGSCGSFQYSNVQTVIGWVNITITGASTSPNNKTIMARIDCTEQSGGGTPGGDLFGVTSTNVYLVQ